MIDHATVREVMTPSPTCVQTDADIVEAARLMTTENVGSLPVVDADQKLVGMVTDRDLVRHVLARDLDPTKTTVSSVCVENPVVAIPDDYLSDALERMAREQVRRLPVVDDGRPVGILAQADVARNVSAESTGEMVGQISRD
jgi:CBS domain-containing protein